MQSSELRASSLLVATIAGVITVAFFLPIDTIWKIILVALLLVVGLTDIAVGLNWVQRYRDRLGQRRREEAIRRHPDLVNELLRLNGRVREVLYGNTADQPSLRIQGTAVLNEIPNSPSADFAEKLTIMERSFSAFSAHLDQTRYQNRKWNSTEFAEAVMTIENHLLLLPQVFNTIYRAYQDGSAKGSNLQHASRIWNDYRDRYNAVLEDWRVFMSKVTREIGYVNESMVKGALPLG